MIQRVRPWAVVKLCQASERPGIDLVGFVLYFWARRMARVGAIGSHGISCDRHGRLKIRVHGIALRNSGIIIGADIGQPLVRQELIGPHRAAVLPLPRWPASADTCPPASSMACSPELAEQGRHTTKFAGIIDAAFPPAPAACSSYDLKFAGIIGLALSRGIFAGPQPGLVGNAPWRNRIAVGAGAP